MTTLYKVITFLSTALKDVGCSFQNTLAQSLIKTILCFIFHLLTSKEDLAKASVLKCTIFPHSELYKKLSFIFFLGSGA